MRNFPENQDSGAAGCRKPNQSFNDYQCYFSGMADRAALQKKIRHILTEIAGDRALYLEIALHEAVNNILLHGSGSGFIRIRQRGRRVTLRVRDCKQGFDAQALLRRFETHSVEELAEAVSSMETGRGILIMKLFTDKMYYSRSGSEVMLVYNRRGVQAGGGSIKTR